MAFYSQTMLQIALSLAEHDPSYEEIAFTYFQHVVWTTYAMDRVGDNPDEMWDEKDGFCYDVLRLPDGRGVRMRLRSMVGLLPLCASTVFEPGVLERLPRLRRLIDLFRERHPKLMSRVAPTGDGFVGHGGRRLLSVLDRRKLERVLGYLLDETEFLSPHGIRSLSRHHLEHPYVVHVGSQTSAVRYLPAESDTGMFGGNSNWRGPVWMPVNGLLVRGLLELYRFYGDEFTVECPTGSGTRMTLFEVAREITRRLASLFLRDASGRRPVFGTSARLQQDPHWRDLVLFFEYFDGDTGKGLGASHQTGWTGIIACLLQVFARPRAAGPLEVPEGHAG